jgi:hypothetical protein
LDQEKSGNPALDGRQFVRAILLKLATTAGTVSPVNEDPRGWKTPEETISQTGSNKNKIKAGTRGDQRRL